MTKWLALLVTCLALGLVVGACGDDDEDEGGGGAAQTTEQPAEETGGGGGQAAKAEVTMKDTSFEPSTLEVKKGTTVTWTNEDSVGHDVTKTGGAGPEFSSGDPGGMSQGDTFKHKFTTAGEVEYVCTVHPGMSGTITVK